MARAFRYAMSNPAMSNPALAIVGNPGRTAKRRSKSRRRNPSPHDATTRIMRKGGTSNILKAITDKARALERRKVLNEIAPFLSSRALKRNPRRAAPSASPQGLTPMPKKKRRSAAQRAATAKMLKCNRARRSPKRAPKARKARRSKRRVARAAAPRRTRRVNRRASRPRRASRRGLRVRNVPASAGTVVVVRKVKRGRVRRARRSAGRRFRSVRVNPGLAGFLTQGPHSFVGGLTAFRGNLKSAMGGGAKGYLIAAGGAVGAIAIGTFLRRSVFGMAMKVAPAFAAGPIGSRLLSFGSYYGAGWAIARFAVKSPSTKSAILAGAAIAAIVEVLRPGTVAALIARVPVLGPMLAGRLAGVDADLAGYVEEQLAGIGSDAGIFDPAVVRGDDCNEGIPTSLAAYNLGVYGLDGDDDSMDGMDCGTMDELVSVE